MRFVFISLFLLFSTKTFSAQNEIVVNIKALHTTMCELTLNAFNVPACVRELNDCVRKVRARRIFIPDSEGNINAAAIRECITIQ